jgi:hypothetical protein
METAVLNILTHQLTHVLKDTLPKISTSWWQSLVIEKLTLYDTQANSQLYIWLGSNAGCQAATSFTATGAKRVRL